MQVDDPQRLPRGPIAWMAGSGVAPNLLMLAILAVGLVSLTGLQRESWPVFKYGQIEVSMSYPGASPEEIEESIIVRIEEQIRSLDNIKAVHSVAAPGIASVRAELTTRADIDQAMDEIKAAVARVHSFPDRAEQPEFRELTSRQSIIRMIVHGADDERSLKEIAWWIENELELLPAVSWVETTGVRDYEISIEVPLFRLRALGLTLQDIADAVRRSALDLSAGHIETRQSQVRVRTLGQRYEQQEFEDIVVLSRSDGTAVRLGDIADVRDAFKEADLIVRHNGRPAAFVEVYRAEGDRILDVAEAVREQLSGRVIPSLPEGVGVTVWNDESQLYAERVSLLLKNAILGLILVLVALALFLQARLAMWVAVGLAVSCVGALGMMLALDISISNISLLVFVLAIGIIVDDAIVVAEHIHHERMHGAPGLAAAIRGARRIKLPLTIAVLTSVTAFTPVFFIPGGIGETWFPLPVIIITMLMISLVESLFILPNHLSHLPGPDHRPAAAERFLVRIQGLVDGAMRRFVEGPLDRALRYATEQPLVVIAGAIGLLIISLSLAPAGIVRTTFADVVEGDFVTASLEMPDGTPAQQTYEVAQRIEAAGRRAVERLAREQPQGAPPLLTGALVTVGERPRVEGGGVVPEPTLNPQSNLAAIDFKLAGAQQRAISASAVAQAWREEAGELPQARSVTFSGEVLDFGAPVEAILSHPDPDRLARIASLTVENLRGIEGVFDVRSEHAPGVPEIRVALRPEARTLGLTLESMAQQVRAAFYGAEAVRVQRGREEVPIYVRLPAGERSAITDIEDYLIRTPGGAEIPLIQAASLSAGVSPPSIRRRDGQRVVTITAEVDPAVISGVEANRILADDILDPLAEENDGLSYIYGGEQQQQMESLGALFRGFVLALFVIFALFAISLRSYVKPFIIMAVIPFGIIGVILGHLILGVPMSATSIMGVLGLSGVVVNDSLVMVDFIDQRLREGASPRTAIIEGAKGRFRPIFLTSATTFLAFTPLILERAIQAQFLLPFAASLGVGITIATALLMLMVPALYSIYQRLVPAHFKSGAADAAIPAQTSN